MDIDQENDNAMGLVVVEKHLQEFFEKSVDLLPGDNLEFTIVNKIVERIQRQLISESGKVFAPNLFQIYLNPIRVRNWHGSSLFFNNLAGFLQEETRQNKIFFSTIPAFRLNMEAALSFGEVEVKAFFQSDITGKTAVVNQQTPKQVNIPDRIPTNACLVIDENSTFSLEEPVINIGRKSENHLVINDPRVSRSHAQIRAIHDKYVIFDLRSTGGTFVNGQRINQATLHPGDIISLAGVPIIYVEENRNSESPLEEKTTLMENPFLPPVSQKDI